MAPLPPRRRVSYGIPFPPSAVPIPRLCLPPFGYDRQGSVNPIVISNFAQHPEPTLHPPSENEPRHRLGALAPLPSHSTSPSSSAALSPEGILNTGARDGFVISWDLNIPVRKRIHNHHFARHSSSAVMVISLAMSGSSRRRRMSGARTSGCIPFEHQWELDVDAFRPGQVCFALCALFLPNQPSIFKPSTLRQAAQIHSDRVNDILLCN